MKKASVCIITILCLLPLSIKGQQLSFDDESPKREYRAVWLTTIKGLDWPRTVANTPQQAERQQQQLCGMLDSLKQLNINTILLQTRIRGDVIYPSEIEPFNSIFTGKEGDNPGYDPLAFAIEECHKRGLQLHAWIVTLPIGDKRHIAEMGRNALTKRRPELCRLYQNSWYMEPGEPETAEYLATLVKEIVTRYNIDGIHFDYIRYPDRPASYPDKSLYKRYGKGEGLAQWRRNNITALARRLSDEIKRLKPWVCVSCAPLGKYKDTSRYSSYGWNAYGTVYQEAQEWLRDSIMDALFPMLYYNDNHFFPFVQDWKENDHNRHVAAGIGIYQLLPAEKDWEADDLIRQLCSTRRGALSGQAFFRARHLLDNLKGVNSFIANFYRNPALPPAVTGSATTAPPAPQGATIANDMLGCRLSWSATPANDSEPPLLYNVYADTSYPVNTDNAGNLIATRLCCTEFHLGTKTIPYHFAVTAIDAYGTESEALQWLNPATQSSATDIKLPDTNTRGAVIKVYDIQGRLLKKARYAQRISLSAWNKGYYKIVVCTPKGTPLYSTIVRR